MRNYKIFSFLASLIIFSMVFNACKSACTKGSGKQISENRSVETFSSVVLAGSYKVVISQDSSSKMNIVADDNIMVHIKTSVSGGVLEIKMDDNICNPGEIMIALSAKEWKGIEVSGVSKINSSSQIKAEEFKIDLSGSSSLTLDLVAAAVSTRSSGSAEINLKGQARSHAINLSGSGVLKAFDFVVGDYKIITSGASEMEINVLNDLKVKTSGSSKITYKGSPINVSNDKSGSSVLIKVQ